MFPNALLLLLLFSIGAADRLKYHLDRLVDRNISACDDFYHHVCSQSVDPDQFFINRVPKIFKDAIIRMIPNALLSSPIAHDLNSLRSHVDTEEDNDYENLARNRCKNDVACYEADREYYANFVTDLNITIEVHNTTVFPDESDEEKIEKLISDTTANINNIIPYTRFNDNNTSLLEYASSKLNAILLVYVNLQTRLHLVHFAKSNNTFTDFYDIKDFAENLKERMISYVEKTSWLKNDEIGAVILEKIKQRIASIQTYHDFDDVDGNITALQNINRNLNAFYFSQTRKTGVRGVDTVLALNSAIKNASESDKSREMQNLFARIYYNFELNAFYMDEAQEKTVTMLAPFLYRPTIHSDILNEPILTLYVFGHELYHSLFSPRYKILLDLYGHRRECIEKHYSKTCRFAMGACGSGSQTITEDGADLEAFRLVYSLFEDKYDVKTRKNLIHDLGTTYEQAFFYYATSTWCREDNMRSAEQAKDVHSDLNIRINAAFSLMPEFTAAFQCKKGDEMYIEKEQSCYVFGPDAK